MESHCVGPPSSHVAESALKQSNLCHVLHPTASAPHNLCPKPGCQFEDPEWYFCGKTSPEKAWPGPGVSATDRQPLWMDAGAGVSALAMLAWTWWICWWDREYTSGSATILP